MTPHFVDEVWWFDIRTIALRRHCAADWRV